MSVNLWANKQSKTGKKELCYLKNKKKALTLNKRKQFAQAKRNAITNSQQFGYWWEHRRKAPNKPDDPYHAYQTDKSIKAKQALPEVWRQAPNKTDNGTVDYPYGETYRPAKKPVNRQEPTQKSKVLPKDKTKRSITLMVEKLSQQHGIPTPDIKFRQKGALTGQARTGTVLSRTYGLTSLHNGEILVGTSGKSQAQKIAAAAHETGHVIHAQHSATKKGLDLEKNYNIKPYSGIPKNYTDEKAAWRIAEPAIKTLPKKQQATARWLKAFALKTYRHKGQKENVMINSDKKEYRIKFLR